MPRAQMKSTQWNANQLNSAIANMETAFSLADKSKSNTALIYGPQGPRPAEDGWTSLGTVKTDKLPEWFDYHVSLFY
jgi:hypothetical protein